MRHTGIVGEVLCPSWWGGGPRSRRWSRPWPERSPAEGGCAVITGEAGIGKSRLIRELSRMAAGRQVPVAMGRAVPASASAPYRPVTEALLQLLRRRPLPDDPSLAPWLPHLAALLPEQWPATGRLTRAAGWTRRPSGGRRCCSCCAAWGLMGWWSPWRTCTGRTPTRCPWSSTWPTTPPASLSCSPSPSAPSRRPRHRTWPGGSGEGRASCTSRSAACLSARWRR